MVVHVGEKLGPYEDFLVTSPGLPGPLDRWEYFEEYPPWFSRQGDE